MSRIIREWNPDKVRAMVSGKLVDNMDRACDFAAGQARNRVPKRTGITHDDIAYEVSAHGNTIEGRVGVKRGKSFYAFFVEMGTRKMAAHPFLRPAVFGNAAEIVRIIRGGK